MKVLIDALAVAQLEYPQQAGLCVDYECDCGKVQPLAVGSKCLSCGSKLPDVVILGGRSNSGAII